MNRNKRTPGPWSDEVDELDFEHVGLFCALRRGLIGAWCGYVRVPSDHPLHGVAYGAESPTLAEMLKEWLNRPIGDNPGISIMLAAMSGSATAAPDIVFRVHGGITYSDAMPGGAEESDHVGEWWFGFDCAHVGDLMPGMSEIPGIHLDTQRDTYRDIAYVEAETGRLAEQLVALGNLTEASP